MDISLTRINERAVEALRTRFHGALLQPEEECYDPNNFFRMNAIIAPSGRL
jgi:hypothetical protein